MFQVNHIQIKPALYVRIEVIGTEVCPITKIGPDSSDAPVYVQFTGLVASVVRKFAQFLAYRTTIAFLWGKNMRFMLLFQSGACVWTPQWENLLYVIKF